MGPASAPPPFASFAPEIWRLRFFFPIEHRQAVPPSHPAVRTTTSRGGRSPRWPGGPSLRGNRAAGQGAASRLGNSGDFYREIYVGPTSATLCPCILRKFLKPLGPYIVGRGKYIRILISQILNYVHVYIGSTAS
jgi:hypothetical protein